MLTPYIYFTKSLRFVERLERDQDTAKKQLLFTMEDWIQIEQWQC